MKSVALGGLGLLGHELRQSLLMLGSVGEGGQPAPESGLLCVPLPLWFGTVGAMHL